MMYRIAVFEVPTEVIGQFIEKLTELDLENSIVGKTGNEDIEINVRYEKNQYQQVDELETLLATLIEEMEEVGEVSGDE